MKLLKLALGVSALCVVGCAHKVQQIPEFSAVRVYGSAVIFVSATNCIVPTPDTREGIVGLKVLRKGESMALHDRHGTITYEVRKVSSDEVVLKWKSAYAGPGLPMKRKTRTIAVKPYGLTDAVANE